MPALNPFGETTRRFDDRRAIGEIKVHSTEKEAWGEGKCPMCQHLITAHIDWSEFAAEGIFFTKEQKEEMITKFMTKSHKPKCRGVIVKPYDGRFNVLKKNEKGELVVPMEEWHRIDSRDLA